LGAIGVVFLFRKGHFVNKFLDSLSSYLTNLPLIFVLEKFPIEVEEGIRLDNLIIDGSSVPLLFCSRFSILFLWLLFWCNRRSRRTFSYFSCFFGLWTLTRITSFLQVQRSIGASWYGRFKELYIDPVGDPFYDRFIRAAEFLFFMRLPNRLVFYRLLSVYSMCCLSFSLIYREF
jgi:hypothetical protein